MAGLTTSAGAVDIYSTTPEVEPLLKSSALMSTYDSGISVTAVEPSDLSTYLTTTYNGYSHTVAQLLATLNGYITQYLQGSGSIPNGVGGTISGSNVSIWQLTNQGFQSLSYILNSIDGSLDNLKDYSTILQNIYTSVGTVNTSVGTVNTSVGSLQSSLLNQLETRLGETYVNSDNTEASSSTVKPRLSFILRNGLLALNRTLTLNRGEAYLYNDSSVQLVDANKARLSYFVSQGFLGLSNLLQVDPYENFLNSGGSIEGIGNVSGRLSWLIRVGLLGLSANIKGSATDNIYASILNDNNNTTTTVNSTGLGPLLNTQLSNIGENLGHLAYVFASDDEIKLKQDSEPIMEEVGNIYDDSDSKVKVNADGIGGVKNVVGEFGSFLEVDAGIDDVITIVTNPQSYSWLTQETLNDLDTVGVSTFTRGQSWHDRLYSEFYEEYFPERID